ncbi:DUF934 domain-containing protein [Chromobacterium amazonense]|uniref:DUF934 domain-containing protein n=1 Tax=Chromobacterium amazonense TaxID=1382803 RepID=A0ABU8V240_9NEIS|nr:DUF934 domain-containing protein [Chromobacterium amazonense]KIA80704.1 hypothetical protein QR66_08590 [Chromobacterium piscinae]MDQ4540591.1 DUF934 domain-containing protein [Chromobacterium amazonense]OHX18797.1 hypothetical protein BI343_00435 [Chromobacterium amazonense]
MPRYIKNGKAQIDAWTLLRADESGALPAAPADADVIVPLAAWLADPAGWQARPGRTGVWLAPDDEPARLAPYLASLAVIAVDFPVFTDGRGYSLARLLRERYDFAGELRAVGDVWQDLIHPLWQVGFDAFLIKDGKALNEKDCYNTFSDGYQVTYRQPQPLFRRRVTLS